MFRKRRDADCGPGYFLKHSKTILNYRFLTGVKLVVGIKEAVHYSAVPSCRMDDQESAEQLVGYARFLAAKYLIHDRLGVSEPVLLVWLLLLLNQSGPALAEVGTTLL